MTTHSKSKTLAINSDVFKWLYETSGCTKKEITENTSITPTALSHYLETTDNVTLPLDTIKDLAKLYSRPITAFLISTPPADTIIPKDFRRKPTSEGYSKALHKKFIKAHRNLRLFVEMSKNVEEPYIPELPNVTINDDPFDIAEKERERLKIGILEISKDPKTAYNQWRNILASYAIPVFQYNMDKDGVRGFICRYGDAAAIIINSGEKEKGRIFTIFHEYAHLLLKTNPVCSDDGEESTNKEIDDIEKWCDNFAGAFLIPKKAISENPKVLGYLDSNEYSKAAETLARSVTVSTAAALVRLQICGYIPPTAAAIELARWKRDTNRFVAPSSDLAELTDEDEESINTDTKQKEKKKGGPDAARLRLSEIGTPYIKLADRNYDNGHISYAKYLDNIGISKVSHERFVKKKVME